jgi:hypothetical protein
VLAVEELGRAPTPHHPLYPRFIGTFIALAMGGVFAALGHGMSLWVT